MLNAKSVAELQENKNIRFPTSKIQKDYQLQKKVKQNYCLRIKKKKKKKKKKKRVETFVSLSNQDPAFTCVRCHRCIHEKITCFFHKDKIVTIPISLMVRGISAKLVM